MSNINIRSIPQSRRKPKSRAADAAWQQKEYEINMRVKRGELIWDLETDKYIENTNEDNE